MVPNFFKLCKMCLLPRSLNMLLVCDEIVLIVRRCLSHGLKNIIRVCDEWVTMERVFVHSGLIQSRGDPFLTESD